MYVHNSCFVDIVCNFEFMFMILADSDREFKWFQGFVNISIYQLLELELLRVCYLRVRKWEVRKWEVRNLNVTEITVTEITDDKQVLQETKYKCTRFTKRGGRFSAEF